MALDDILLYEEDIQAIILEIPEGLLEEPDDIIFEYIISELILIGGGGNYAFIS